MNKSILSMSYTFTPLFLLKSYWLIFAFLLITTNTGLAKPALQQTPEAEIEQGEKTFQHGDFENAILHWSTAAQLVAEGSDTTKQITILTKLADAYQALGQNTTSIDILITANTLATDLDKPRLLIATMNSLGAAYTATGQYEKATEFLKNSIKKARAINAINMLAATLNNYGNLLTQKGKYNQAVKNYSESANLAHASKNPQLVAKASVNSAIAALEMGDVDKTEEMLTTAQTNLETTVDDHKKAFNLISLARIAQRLSLNHANSSRWQSFIYHNYKQAATIGETISDARATSYATGYLGGLYLEKKRYKDASQLTRQAIFSIENTQAPEILFRWQWQTGRILRAKGEIEAAIPAYQQAVSTLNTARLDLLTRPRDASSFRKEISPLYLELADLLLQSSATIQDSKKLQHKLVAARNTMEQLKAAELQDYFKDDCVSALQQKVQPLETIDSKTAAIYPILLADRTEILLSLPDGIKRFTIATNRTELTNEVKHFRRKLENRTTREYLPHAQKLYQWLIAPLQTTLTEYKIDTLIMVPDESLRTIPLAALHDGEAFIIEKYAISNTPGLNLTDPKPLSTKKVQVLAIGLSEAVQGFPALPNVTSELSNIQKIFGGQILQDNEFLLNKVQNELAQTPYNIVHIASHGQFKSDARESFVLSFDEKLSMNKLEQLIGLSRFRDKPIELLTLSACQTAAGDDRAALGLAGIAVKAGARSAVATLWLINDQAASILISEFYQQLKETKSSKAQALRNAQVHLINDTAYQHPYFWSPFLLIGNWL
jgi:CHAT domain-containing protein/Tfp pilus assembly protein PilF